MAKRRLAGNRKMAGKKGQVVQLQSEVNTEEEWNKLLEKDGLVVIDVYSEWCGPCLGMVGTLKKIKLEIGGDFLSFAIAKSDDIEALARFRNRSEPTWMFIAGGQLVNLMFGADAPRLTNLIISELLKEKMVQKGEATRNVLPFDELTPEEQVRQIEKEKLRLAAKAHEDAIEATVKAAANCKEIHNLLKYIRSYTVILLMPYLYEDGIGQAWQTLEEELRPMGYSVQDEEDLELHPSLASEIIYGGLQEISEEFSEELESGKAVAKLMLYKPPENKAILQPSGTNDAAEPEESTGEDNVLAAETDAIFGAMKVIYGCCPTEGGQPPNMDPESLEAKYRKATNIPAIWTPSTPNGKANAIMKLFPKFAEKYKLPPPPILPPIITIVFDAIKSPEVNEMMQNYQDEVIITGYFTGSDPSSAKKFATSQEQYDQRQCKQDGETLVLVVSRKRSDPLLSFCQLGPIYISDNVDDGKKDYEAFFPEDVEENEEFPPDKPEKKSKLSATEPQYGGTGDEVSYTKGEKFAPACNEVCGLSSAFEQISPLEVRDQHTPAEYAKPYTEETEK